MEWRAKHRRDIYTIVLHKGLYELYIIRNKKKQKFTFSSLEEAKKFAQSKYGVLNSFKKIKIHK
ncbi:hypothetical protein [Alkalihalophilus marmarensis]|uniref:hypothetical protein n=1 Tax=Alkalihalophilus marmarensis TaxID=521377 RepID=UPI002DC0192A|nr:hypothetical protein [Alkalihalophilus marmarensis]MEC2074425.1 hypothetical protein [Alkalihalophilus marmarensis]